MYEADKTVELFNISSYVLKLEGIELFSLVSILKLGPLKGKELSSSCGLPKSIVKTVGSIISSTILH